MQHIAGHSRNSEKRTEPDIEPDARKLISTSLNSLLADLFALYIKTKNYHWHMTGPHFRDYHLLLDEQAGQIFDTTDALAERVRKLGKPTIRSIGQIARLQRISDDNSEQTDAVIMLKTLLSDNSAIVARLREAHEVCDTHRDVATASLIENWIDDAERRVWFLYETAGSN